MTQTTNGKTKSKSFERVTFTQSRAMDFFTKKSLSAETGMPPDEWPAMALKELLDNALDACELSNIPPEITITVDESSITVADNGPGIPVETIKKTLDYTTRTSSNSRIVSPTRGSQGNALKTILAASYILSEYDRGFVHISTNGRGFDLEVTTDPILQEPRVSMVKTDPICKNGTAVKVEYPCIVIEDEEWRFLQIVDAYACLNPHSTFKVESSEGFTETNATDPAWKKWMTSDPPSVLWFSDEDMENLVAAHIAHDGEMTVRQFLGTFDGFTGSRKNSQIIKDLDLSRERMRCFAVDGDLDRDCIGDLLQTLKDNSRPIKARRLGVLGEDHVSQCVWHHGADLDTFRYKMAYGYEDDLPFVIEAAFGYLPDNHSRQIFAGINFAGSVDEMPLRIGGSSLGGLLAEQRCDSREPVCLILHLAIPRVNWLDRGKTSAKLEGEVATKFKAVIESVTKDWKKRRDAEDRSQARERREEQLKK
jgi:DNA topoisomerase VI subunit B